MANLMWLVFLMASSFSVVIPLLPVDLHVKLALLQLIIAVTVIGVAFLLEPFPSYLWR